MTQKLTTPGRRQFTRTSTKAQVFVHCRGHFQRARIANCSQAGLQLEGTFGLIDHDQVLIELISGVQVTGKVEWSLGGQTGVVFSEPLDASHPAMVELAHKAT